MCRKTSCATPTTSLHLSPVDIVDQVIPAFHTFHHVAMDHTPPMISSLWDSSLSIADKAGGAEVELSAELEARSLSAVGHDIILFLVAAVVVDPLGKILGVTPVLLYLVLGFVAGPYGLSFFASGTEVNSEIGDIGILFLLFVEGLNLSPERLKALGNFFSLGATQLLLSVALIFFGLFFGGPYLLPIAQDVRVPLDPDVILLLEKPVLAFSIAAAGALSSSAFVLPILKEKGWEKGADGIATLSILLLQDLAVAPLLIILPLVAQYDVDVTRAAGDIEAGFKSVSQDPMSLGILIAKATIGFGLVVAVASLVLRRIFQIVAQFGSSQTFIAASLLVAVGMGVIAEDLGLSATTGAFAAGVLLAESGYRAQIEADIKPFEGILLGVFFVTAGASLDPQTVVTEWPTLVTGIAAFIAVKFGVVLAAGESALGLTRAEALRVAFLLAGGGEFAFVVFKLANNLGVLPEDLGKLLTASVVISMSLSPLLGELAGWSSSLIEEDKDKTKINGNVNGSKSPTFQDYDVNISDEAVIRRAFETFDEDGSGCISAEELRQVLKQPGTSDTIMSEEQVQAVLERFDEDGDGSLQFDEFAALWAHRELKQLKKNTNENGDDSPASSLSKGIVVCGYGEVAQQLCDRLGESEIPYVAFSRDPSRIALGTTNGAFVVYGNGASPSLVRSAGVNSPSAICVAYASEARSLEATLRLQEAFPGVPIYVRASRLDQVKRLEEAGATKVIVESNKVAEAFTGLVGMDGLIKEKMLSALSGLVNEIPFSETELSELAYTCRMSADELAQLYELFMTSPTRNKQGKVQLAELRDELLRRRSTPLDDEELKKWMGYDEILSKWVTEEEEEIWVDFPEFVEFAVGRVELS